jgi:hypothetical protein
MIACSPQPCHTITCWYVRSESNSVLNALQIRVHNDSTQDVFARLYIDGQLVAQRLRKAHTAGTISSIPVSCKEQKELLFSLPRYPTAAEQLAGGKSLEPKKLSELGTIRYCNTTITTIERATLTVTTGACSSICDAVCVVTT